jgi:hypothetical protein
LGRVGNGRVKSWSRKALMRSLVVGTTVLNKGMVA